MSQDGFFYNNLIKPFLPVYEVVFVMYQVIPGKEVQRKEHRFGFEKGAEQEAKAYFNKVLKSTTDFKMVPSEVLLKKGNVVINRQVFGPVDLVHQQFITQKAS